MNKYISSILVIAVLGLIGVGIWFSMKADTKTATSETSTDQYNETEETGAGDTTKENTITNNTDPKTEVKKDTKHMATLHTNKGDITIEFFDADAPNTVANFTKLAGAHFYDGIKFHRVIKGFMIQGGDPLTKDETKADFWGTGGPGYKFADEINAQSDLYVKTGYKKGIVAMANSGPNTNGSQFFIMNEDTGLPPLYTIFGRVTAGQSVVDAIALVKVDENDRPLEPVIISSITLE